MTVPITPTPWFHRAHLCNPPLFGSILLMASEVECPACLMLLTCWDCVYFINFPWLPCFCWGWVGYMVKLFFCLSVLSVFIVHILDPWCCTPKIDLDAPCYSAVWLPSIWHILQIGRAERCSWNVDETCPVAKPVKTHACDHDTVAGPDCGCSGQWSQ